MNITTTAISYANGNPHLGHLFEGLIGDVVNRYNKLKGDKTYFMTGTDEHGQKIYEKAKEYNMETKDFVDHNVNKFVELYENYNINYDSFSRTTDENHIAFVQEIWYLLENNGDIYEGIYEGWYDEKEEMFLSEHKAKLNNYKNGIGNNLIRLKENTHYFKLSKYKNKIIEHLENNPDFIYPEHKHMEILNLLKNNDLNDLSVSRENVPWGIKVPNSDNTIYVWFDALLNYLSFSPIKDWDKNNVTHVIGKDILWFHSVIWISILMSLEFNLPKKIIVHGFVLDNNSEIMSKTKGNVVNPMSLLDSYPQDVIRYYMMKNISNFGNDINFSNKALILMNDSDLANNYGNLVNRLLSLWKKWEILLIDGIYDNKLDNEYIEYMDKYEYNNATNYLMNKISEMNNEITKLEPWKWDIEIENENSAMCDFTSEYSRKLIHISRMLSPFLPNTFEKIKKIFKIYNNNFEVDVKEKVHLFDRIRDNKYLRKQQ